MTIGPEPIKQMDSRSGRLGKAAHLLDPAVEQRPRVMRPRARFGMELHRARAQLGEVEALDRAVVEGNVRRLPRLAGRDREAMVLAGDEDAARGPLDDGVIRAAVAVGELERRVPGGEREQLVAEAD